MMLSSDGAVSCSYCGGEIVLSPGRSYVYYANCDHRICTACGTAHPCGTIARPRCPKCEVDASDRFRAWQVQTAAKLHELWSGTARDFLSTLGPSAIAALTVSEVEDETVKQLDRWSDLEKATLYALLHAQGWRIDKAQRVREKAARDEVKNKK